MARLAGFLQTRFKVLFVLIVFELALAAWTNRFIQDDAFISFRYAANFVSGHGLVWNLGERVEGYTNFLWTLAMSIPLFLGRDPVAFSFGLGIICFVGSLILTYKMSLLVLGSRETALLAMMLLGTNWTFLCYATGGLETQLQACLFVAATYMLLRLIHAGHWHIGATVTLSVISSAAMLTRPDSLLLLAVVLPTALLFLLRERIPPLEKLAKVLALVLPIAVLVGAWTVWRVWYYGDLLPNTFYAKASSLTSPSRGLFYVYKFFDSYLLIPFLVFGLVAMKRMATRTNLKTLLPLTVVLVWTSYVIKVGGDFMEFRLLVPVSPLVFLLVAWLIFVFVQHAQVRVALFALVLLGSLHHASTFGEYSSVHRIRAIRQLYGYVKDENSNWDEIGRVLGQSFDYSPDVTIATTAAGAIPYYSGLKTIDMHGMNDQWVARYGELVGSEPGHQRLAPLSYLVKRSVNLVIGYPWMRSGGDSSGAEYSTEDLSRLEITFTDPVEIPSDSKIVEIPIDENHRLVVFYLVRSPVVDEAIRTNRWPTYPIPRT